MPPSRMPCAPKTATLRGYNYTKRGAGTFQTSFKRAWRVKAPRSRKAPLAASLALSFTLMAQLTSRWTVSASDLRLLTRGHSVAVPSAAAAAGAPGPAPPRGPSPLET